MLLVDFRCQHPQEARRCLVIIAKVDTFGGIGAFGLNAAVQAVIRSALWLVFLAEVA
ncbi:hypothetical protein D3C71_2185260 [compost metagenome]